MANYPIESYSGEEIEALLQKIDNLDDATQDNAGLMSASDKSKLDEIQNGAEENVIEEVQLAGEPVEISEKAVNIPVDQTPTPNSAALITSGGVAAQISQLGQKVEKLEDILTQGQAEEIVYERTSFPQKQNYNFTAYTAPAAMRVRITASGSPVNAAPTSYGSWINVLIKRGSATQQVVLNYPPSVAFTPVDGYYDLQEGDVITGYFYGTGDFSLVISKEGEYTGPLLFKEDVEDVLDSDATNKPLSARMGKVLNQKLPSDRTTLVSMDLPPNINGSGFVAYTFEKAGDYTIALQGNASVPSGIRWDNVVLLLKNADGTTKSTIFSAKRSITSESFSVSALAGEKVSVYAYFAGELSFSISGNEAIDFDALRKSVLGGEILGQFSPNSGAEQTAYLLKAKEKLTLRVTASGSPVSAAPTSYSSWYSLVVRNSANTATTKIIFNCAKGASFEPHTYTVSLEEGEILRVFSYLSGDAQILVENLNSVSLDEKFEMLEEKIAAASGSSMFISIDSIAHNRTNLIQSWTTGQRIDDSLQVISDAAYNLSDAFPINGGIFYFEYNGALLTSPLRLTFLDNNLEPVANNANETMVGADGTTRTTHWAVLGGYYIIRSSYINENNIAYVRISAPATYDVNNLKFYRYGRKVVTGPYSDSFEKASGAGRIIRMSWFDRTAGDSEVIAAMMDLAAMGATLYFDAGDVSLSRTIATKVDNLGKMLSFDIPAGTKISASNNMDFLMDYVGTSQTDNAEIYDENGNVFSTRPCISGGTWLGGKAGGGITMTQSRGLKVLLATFCEFTTYGVKINSSARSYEYLIANCSFDYKSMTAADNTAIWGNIDDSMFTDIIITGYHTGVNVTGGACFFERIHGWIGFNYQTQLSGSSFLIAKGYVSQCYADTYEVGFSGGKSFSQCRIFSNPAFSPTLPTVDIWTAPKFGCNF